MAGGVPSTQSLRELMQALHVYEPALSEKIMRTVEAPTDLLWKHLLMQLSAAVTRARREDPAAWARATTEKKADKIARAMQRLTHLSTFLRGIENSDIRFNKRGQFLRLWAAERPGTYAASDNGAAVFQAFHKLEAALRRKRGGPGHAGKTVRSGGKRRGRKSKRKSVKRARSTRGRRS